MISKPELKNILKLAYMDIEQNKFDALYNNIRILFEGFYRLNEPKEKILPAHRTYRLGKPLFRADESQKSLSFSQIKEFAPFFEDGYFLSPRVKTIESQKASFKETT